MELLEMNDLPLATAVSLTTTAVMALIIVKLWSSSTKQKKKHPPMADVGLLQTIRELTGGKLPDFLIQHFQEKGSVCRLPIPGIVVVANPIDARAIYNSNAMKAPAMYSVLDKFTSGPSIVSISHGDNWHHRRKALNPAFAPKLVKRMNQVALETADQWIASRRSNQSSFTIDVGLECILMTITVICKAAFEYDIVDPQECQKLMTAMKLCVGEFSFKSMINPLRQFATPLLPARRRAFKESVYLKEFAIKMMDLYRHRKNPTPDTVIDRIVKNDNYKDDSERIPDIIVILFAGHDTTGYTLAFALRELALNPEEQQKLRKELEGVTVAGSHIPYVKAVFNEAMRLSPAPVLSALRQLGNDLITKDGYHIGKGSIVFFAQVAQCRDPTIYHPDPFKFDPSRWLEGNVTDEMKSALFPFSLGSRNCVGQAMANAELHSILPQLIRQFEFSVQEKGEIVTRGTMRMDNCILKAIVRED